MGSVNVNRNVSDAFYRYKMPRIVAKVEGKGNGIKTVVVNMVEVARALARPPTYPTKYFGCELGAQTQFDLKNERYIVNGSHDAQKLQSLLDGFIQKYVLCPECENPETVLSVLVKKQTIVQSCKACGYHCNLDMKHKLTTYILKNPPDQNPAVQRSTQPEGKKGKRSKGKQNGEVTNKESLRPASPKGDPKSDNSDGDWGTENGELNDWVMDTSKEAVRARMDELSTGIAGLAMAEDLEKSQKERVDLFYEFVKNRHDAGTLDSTAKEVVSEADRLEVRDKGPLILCEVLFDKQILTQIKTHRILLLWFTHENEKAQKYLLGGVEKVIESYKDILLPKVPHILKALYDSDIVEEKVLLDWSKKVSKKYVSKDLSSEIHTRAGPFIKWLQEAEEEESSSDGESDIEIEYDDRAKASPLKEQPTARPAVSTVENLDDEDGLDIDAI